ncbi:MAG: hypothetical protein ABII76_25335, partial [Pseudomonadota bacterium]
MIWTIYGIIAVFAVALWAAFKSGVIVGRDEGYRDAVLEVAHLGGDSVLRHARRVGIIKDQPTFAEAL